MVTGASAHNTECITVEINNRKNRIETRSPGVNGFNGSCVGFNGNYEGLCGNVLDGLMPIYHSDFWVAMVNFCKDGERTWFC